MKVESYGISNVGMKRGQNEDNYLVNESLGLYVVADGMGGHVGGEFASKMAVTTVEEVLAQLSQSQGKPPAEISKDVSHGEKLKFAIREASRRIFDQALYDESLRGMGTTIVAMILHKTKAYVAHVGDSRGYLIREGKIEQITQDHSLVGEQIRAGILSPDDVKAHRYKNIITRSVGYQEFVESDLCVKELQVGDKLLLCSDGLSNMVTDSEMLELATRHSLQETCENLVALANERGGDDNITVVIAQTIEIN